MVVPEVGMPWRISNRGDGQVGDHMRARAALTASWVSDVHGSEARKELVGAGRSRVRLFAAAAGLALSVSLFGAGGALAESCGPATVAPAAGLVGTSASALSSVIGSAVTAADTAFLLQSTTFVGAPPNPAPGQQGAGVWVRPVGGQVNISSQTTAAVTGTATGTATVSCSQKVDTNFAGVQLGSDIAKLNVNGWNFHVGTTAGYLGTNGNLVGGLPSIGSPAGYGPLTNTTNVPFIGGYAAATNGGFFVDGVLRAEYYQTTLNSPIGLPAGLQNIDAHGYSLAGEAGYNWKVPNSNWFVEPSAGFSLSRVKVDPFNFSAAGFGSTLQLADINSDIGRLGVRAGTTIEGGNFIWQPFAAVSVWHEFGPNLTSSLETCPGCTSSFLGAGGTSFSASSSTTTFGTYGQYSLGLAATVPNTGWLGFVRVDYRDGSNLQGLSGTGGLRYQFTPEPIRSVMPVKAPIYKAPPFVQGVNWTGFYIGGFGGAGLGTADWNYLTGAVSPHVGGFLGGGDIGYNYQTGKWVLGIEADLSGTNTKGGTACGGLAANGVGKPSTGITPMFQMTCNESASWLGTATARIGYAWERALFYVKGGAAWTDERFSATCNVITNITAGINQGSCTNPAVATSTGLAASAASTGWTIGYGTEFALTQNWSAKAETDYVSFGDTDVTASDGSPLKVGMHLWEGKIGLNYRFSSAALATNY